MNVSKRPPTDAAPHPATPVAHIAGTGSYLPKKVLSTADLETMVETAGEWIVTRTGIHERRIARDDEYTSDLASSACQQALAAAALPAAAVDLIICATITPDMPFPSTACLVQQKIGAPRAACFDIEAACSGFIYGMEIGRQFIASGTFRNVLVVAADKLSSIVDWKDRNTCVLFGDGAGAVLLQPSQGANGILAASLGANGAHGELLMMPGGGSRHPSTAETVQARLHYLKMAGREVYKQAILTMGQSARDALKHAHLQIEDIACIIPHQPNLRIIEGLAERMHVGMDRFVINLDRYGNMSAASAAVALDEAVRSGRIVRGDHLLMTVFGAGLTWGSVVMKW